MINIIKHGKKKITKTFYKCRCKYCGCEFEATEDEVEVSTKYILGDRYWFSKVNCPDCGNTLHINSTVSRRTEEEFIDYDQLTGSAAER